MRKDLYEDLGEREDSHFWHKAKRQLVADLVVRFHSKNTHDTKILDIGCGTGGNVKWLGQFGHVWGIDGSKEAVKYCRKQDLKNIRLNKAEKISFPDNSFHIITILDLLEHADDRRVLKEAYRQLKKGGLLIITVPAYPWLWSRWDEILGHKRRYTERSLRQILSTQHFEILKLSYCYSFLLLPAMIVRVIKSFRFKNADYPSDFALGGSGILNTLLGTLSSWERFIMIQKNASIPFGLSIVAVCRK